MVSGIFCEVDIIVPWPNAGNRLFGPHGVQDGEGNCMTTRLTAMPPGRSIQRLAGIGRALLVVISLPLTGLAADDLYTVIVPLDPQIAEEREARDLAYKDALERVLIRVTGSDEENHLAGLAEYFPNPSRYVLRFRSGLEGTLEVSFDGNAVQQVLRQTRNTVWGEERPLTLVWLAVDWGDGEREIIGADSGRQTADETRSIDRHRLLRERVEKTAERRGIPVVFPLLDIEDRQSIGFGDIWGGFDQPLIDASRRYGASSILVGRVRPDSSQANRWTSYFGEEQLQWFGEPEAVTGMVADQLAAHFAIQGDAVLQNYSLTIDGIDSVIAYGKVQQMMDNLSVAEDFALTTVAGQKVEYRVSVYGGIDRLNKALELSGVLYPALNIDDDFRERPIADPDHLDFVYLP
jgi:uncharacterized protein